MVGGCSDWRTLNVALMSQSGSSGRFRISDDLTEFIDCNVTNSFVLNRFGMVVRSRVPEMRSVLIGLG